VWKRVSVFHVSSAHSAAGQPEDSGELVVDGLGQLEGIQPSAKLGELGHLHGVVISDN
jgi:hypothetical protein